jgi:hypothetical protein
MKLQTVGGVLPDILARESMSEYIRSLLEAIRSGRALFLGIVFREQRLILFDVFKWCMGVLAGVIASQHRELALRAGRSTVGEIAGCRYADSGRTSSAAKIGSSSSSASWDVGSLSSTAGVGANPSG